MTSNVEEQLDSSSLWNLLYFYCNQFYFLLLSNLSITSNFTSNSFTSLLENGESQFKIVPYFRHLISLLPYDDFQFELLKVFCAIIIANTGLLFVVWKVYGKQICQRFMKPGKGITLCTSLALACKVLICGSKEQIGPACYLNGLGVDH